jgi:hypothetical protein
MFVTKRQPHIAVVYKYVSTSLPVYPLDSKLEPKLAIKTPLAKEVILKIQRPTRIPFARSNQ